MPEPRRDRTHEAAIRVTLEPASRDPLAVRRRYRRGWRGTGHGRGSVPFEVRNDIPVKFYPLGRNTRAESMTEEEAARHLGARNA